MDVCMSYHCNYLKMLLKWSYKNNIWKVGVSLVMWRFVQRPVNLSWGFIVGSCLVKVSPTLLAMPCQC